MTSIFRQPARCALTLFLTAVLAHEARFAAGADLESALDTLRNVQADGAGNGAASEALREIVQSGGSSDLVEVLAAIDDAGPLAANWLRSAVDSIAQRVLKNDGDLPRQELKQFTLDTRHDPRARRLAYELLQRVDSDEAARLLPQFVNDPSVELRRDAVAELLGRANKTFEAGDKQKAGALYRQALDGARDDDQIKDIVEKLRSLGIEVDLPKHFGFLTSWRIIGPFHNKGGKGFQEVFPPEHELEEDARYQGLSGPVEWTEYSTEDDYGMVNVNDVLGSKKEVTAYAWTQFESPDEQKVELRLGCKNAWKLWVNGELLFGRDEYHRGMRIDQYRINASLRKGVNDILVKVCQNEMVESWTVEWQFQLRVCDSAGTAILAAAE